MAVGGDGDAAAQMGHHQIHVPIGPAHGLGIFVGGGPGVEHVAEAGAGHLPKAGDPGLGQQLVAGDCIVDKGGDAQGISEGRRHQPAQIGGVVEHRVVAQAVQKTRVHPIPPGHDVGDDAAPAHHGGQTFQVKALPGQPAAHQGYPIVQLVIEGGVGGQVLVGVGNAAGEQGALVLIYGGLGAGGAGV